MFQFLIKRQQSGDKIILWTCREGDLLKEAVIYCRANGLEFDAINDNIPANKEKYKITVGRSNADYYIDDRNKMIDSKEAEKEMWKVKSDECLELYQETKKSQH